MRRLVGKHFWFHAILLASAVLSGCGRDTDVGGLEHQLQPISAGDECEVCGMLIAGFPGPKGQAFIRQRSEPLKFCSTVDLLSWMLQPETAGVLEAAYVHDMTSADWERPDDNRYIDARVAWYVAGHSGRGAMGPTLATFATQAAADEYSARAGGRVFAYTDIDPELLAGLTRDAASGDAHGAHAH